MLILKLITLEKYGERHFDTCEKAKQFAPGTPRQPGVLDQVPNQNEGIKLS